MEKFAFVLHPLTIGDMRRVSPFIRCIPDSLLEHVLRKKKPFKVSHITGVKSPYAEAEGWFIGSSDCEADDGTAGGICH